MEKLENAIRLFLLLWCNTLTFAQDWNFNASNISRSYFGPGDPWAVDRCPQRIHKEVVHIEFPEDCTKWQKCWWVSSTGKRGALDTLVVQLANCYNCKKPDCPLGKMVYVPERQKCFPPNQLLTTEHKCGTKVPSKGICSGPKDTTDVHRLGKSRFYVMQNGKKTNWLTWANGKKACAKLGLKLAKIDNLQTEVYVGRLLEKFIRPLGWTDNWYWLDAKFDIESGAYIWEDTKKPINFSNFYYRSPRPKGYGSYFDIKGNYISKPKINHCLAQSMPRPYPKSPDQLIKYPMHTSWWEKECDSNKKGNSLCESIDPLCDEERDHVSSMSPFTEESGYYYDNFWPISNRRFVVHWAAQSFDEAKELCKSHNMQIYSPRTDDVCLVKQLKPWMKEVTSYSFWTDLKYKVATKTFVHVGGKEVHESSRNISIRVRRSKGDKIEETCVSYTWNYEESPRNLNFCNCSMNSIVLSPENCNNRIGTICQHPPDAAKKCPNIHAPPQKFTEFYSFDKMFTFKRSAYKQSGSHWMCPEGYERVTKKEIYWPKKALFEKSTYQYDVISPYWLQPENGTCFLSKVSYDRITQKFTRSLTDGNCDKLLGFLLCKQLPMGDSKQAYSPLDDPEHKNPYLVPLEYDDP